MGGTDLFGGGGSADVVDDEDEDLEAPSWDLTESDPNPAMFVSFLIPGIAMTGAL